MIVIVDYGVGNLGSIHNMIKKLGYKSIVSSSLDDIRQADKLILPGVGSFDIAMKNLNNLGMIDILNEKVLIQKTPILGICLGMQLLTKGSEEGQIKGLGYIDAYATKFDNSNLIVPHMGWNIVNIQKDNALFDNTKENRFYFVHSYSVSCSNQSDILTTTNYGKVFVSSFLKENIIGAQFHPEKSHKFGMKFFKVFLESVNAKN